MKKLKKGDLTNIKGLNNQQLYFTGEFSNMSYGGLPLVFLARDLSNKLTYSPYSQQFLLENGYAI